MTVKKAFILHLEAELRSSGNTVGAYSHDLDEFEDFCRGTSGGDFSLDPELVTTADVRAWIASLADAGRSVTTLRRKLQSLRAFFKWAMKTSGLPSNPAADISLPKKRKPLPNFIREKEVEQILSDDSEDGSFATMRAHIIIEMLYSLGLRRAELLALTDADINFTACEIRVTGKRDKTRVLPLPDALAADIRNWQQIRDARYPELPLPSPLIAGPHGAITPDSLYKIVRQALQPVTSGRKSPHTLRHSFATAMVSDGADLDAVRELLGHESLATTQVYTHLSIKDMLASYNAAHPRSNKKPQD